MACLILDSVAKASHQNSTEVQTMIVMRGKVEVKGGRKRLNGRPIRTNPVGENKHGWCKSMLQRAAMYECYTTHISSMTDAKISKAKKLEK